MFAVKAAPEPKSKSTQHICTEAAIACWPPSHEDLAEIARRKLTDNVDSRKSSDTTLAEEFRGAHTARHERFSSMDSSTSVARDQVSDFNETLAKIPGSEVYVIDTPEKLTRLLDMHHSGENQLPLSQDMFPYLHGAISLREKVYFDERFDPSSELHFLAEESEKIALRFQPDSFAKASLSAFHLMTVNSQADESPLLANSVVIEDLLVFKPTHDIAIDPENLDFSNFQQFQHIDQITSEPCNPLAQTNRNFALQTLLMAPISHFLVYNNDMNLATNTDVAKIIDYLRDSDLSRNIYIVDFHCSKWAQTERYLTNFQANKNGVSHEKTPLDLCTMEQNLVWQMYNVTQLFPRLYVGNVLSFKQLVSSDEKAAQYDFKLFIYCHENAQMPSMTVLSQTLRGLETNGLTKPIFLEFSDSVLRKGASLSKEDTLAFLNVLRIINIVANKLRQNILVYSYDGFTGTSLLLLSLALFWGGDHVEEAAFCLFRKPHVKFHLIPGDFVILKNLEIFIQWFKRRPAKETALLQDLCLDKIYAGYRPYLRTPDWFRADHEVNFPAFIYENLFLGSACHASSVAVLSALHVTKVISIGEKPRWYNALNCTFSHEATPDTKGPVVEPLYRFNGGKSLVYEVKITSLAMRAHLFRHGAIPCLKSFIYIHGVEDDGRDSMYPLLVGCPEKVLQKIFVLPGDTEKTLMHCRIGVSRSATLAIASVMKHFHMSLVESYLYVRVRRFNVVIQPNLRLFYELFLFDGYLRGKYKTDAAGVTPYCWWTLCAEIHRLNEQYTG